ncbi:MAG: glycoside hydrolase family 65 protein, partial [Propionicimonas sp.]
MSGGSFDPVDRSRLPIEPWGIVETSYHAAHAGVLETILAVGNGYLGLRGNHDEGTPDAHAHGTFVNGFHETWPIKHAEEAYGFATVGQTIVNVPDAKTMAIAVDAEPLDVSTSHLERYRRWIDFREGILHRDLVWVTTSGKRVHVQSSRLVSFTRRELSQATVTVTLLDADATVTIRSEIRNRQDEAAVPVHPDVEFDPRKAAGFDHHVLLATQVGETAGRLLLGYRAANSGLPLAVAVDHDLVTDDAVEVTSQVTADLAVRRYTVAATAGQPIVLRKTAAYVAQADPSGLLEAGAILDAAHAVGAAAIESEQRDWLASFWERTDIEIGAEPGLQQAVRWCLFQLAQAAARADAGGIGVKGVSGSGYEGHYFWDTEVYLVPFLAHTNPEIARHALQFRIDMLPAARRRAAALGQRGALFPWRTINGEEASAYYPAGT